MEVSCPECGVLFMTDGPEYPVVCPVCECEFDMPFDLDDDWFDNLDEDDWQGGTEDEETD